MKKRAFLMAMSGLVIAGAGCGTDPVGTRGNGLGACVTGVILPCQCADATVSQKTCMGGVFAECACVGHGGPAASDSSSNNGGAGFSGVNGGSAGFSGVSGAANGGSDAAGTFGGSGIGGGAGIGGTAGVSGAGVGGGGAGGTGVMTSGKDPRIPTITDTCPTLATGMVTVKGQQVQLWVGPKHTDKKGAVFFYWHGTGSNSGEASGLLGKALTDIPAGGGIVASFTTSTGKGTNTGNNVWYTGDYEMADVILACAVQQLNIDPRQVYTGGCSAGGLQSGAMVYGRSSYLAGAMPDSGGTVGIPGTTTLEDPTHVPALITTHGKMGAGGDVVGVEFTTTSLNECKDISAKGGMAVDCDHGGGHCGITAAVSTAQWEFLQAHPFGVSPEPYAAGLPGDFPPICKIIK